MDENRELGQAILQLRREAYGSSITLTKDLDPQPIKAEGAAEGKLGGYASVYWVVDSYGECTAPGCFSQSVAERGPQGSNRIPFRYEHEHTVGNHTLMDAEDTKGLRIEAQVIDDGMYGTVLRRHLAAAVPYGISIGFRSLRGRPATPEDPLIWDYAPPWMRENPDPAMVWVLESTKLMENSGVTFPAVEPAQIDSYKGDATRDLEQLLLRLKAGSLSTTQIGLLREIAAALPADRAPESGQAPPLPGAKSDSGDDDDLLFLDLMTTQFERLIA